MSLALAGMSPGCRTAPPDIAPATTTTAAVASGRSGTWPANPPTPIDWAGTGDCLDQLSLLHDMATQSRLEEAHAPPFAVAPATSASSLEWVRGTAVPLIADLPLDSYEDQAAATAAAPCLLLVEQSGDVRAAQRVVDFHTVASEYQSGVRSEKNPDYDAAQARLQEAERETKRRGPGVLQVGDPMLDLVGLVVGGVIAAFGQVGNHDDVDDALAALKETPRSRDRPVYRAYEFERSTVRAGKEATIGVALRDLRSGRMWRSEVRQREMRELAVLEGLDPRDRDYEQHRTGALSRQEFEHWQRQPPQLPMSALVAALVEQGGTEEGPQTRDSELIAEAPSTVSPVDWLAAPTEEKMRPGCPRLRRSRRARALPRDRHAPWTQRPRRKTRSSGWRRAAPGGSARESSQSSSPLRSIRGWRAWCGSRRGAAGATVSTSGRGWSSRRSIWSTHTSVIDVITDDGEAALGLVVHTDAERGLAVVHVPRAGRPALLSDGPASTSGQMVEVLELIEAGQARRTRAVFRGGIAARLRSSWNSTPPQPPVRALQYS